MRPTLDELAELVTELQQRVSHLEERGGAAGGLDHTLLERLAPADEGGSAIHGGLTFAGSLRRGGKPLAWQRNHEAEQVLHRDDVTLAALLAAAGHPLRVRLVKRLLEGPMGSAELAEELDVSSVGKLYHHLEKLAGVGLVRSEGRGVWGVAPEAVVPILVLLAAAGDLA